MEHLGTASAAGVLIGSDAISGPNAYSRLVQIDPLTGYTTVIGDLNAAAVTGLAWDPNHEVLYGYDGGSFRLARIDPTTAHVTPIGQPPGDSGPFQGLEYDSTHDLLYATCLIDQSLYSYDTTTGSATRLGPYGNTFGRPLEGLAYDPVHEVMYAASHNLGSDQAGGGLFTLDLQTGAATFVGHFNAGSNYLAEGLAFDPTLGLFATDTHGADFTFDNELYKIDPATGAATLVGAMGKRNRLRIGLHP